MDGEIEDFEGPFRDIQKRTDFIEAIAEGTPVELAGYEVGWTPRQLKLILAEPMFAEMVAAAQDRALDSVEKAMHRLATEGKNLGAMQMILYNRRPHRWKDLRRIEIKQDTQVSVAVIDATRKTAIELLRTHGVEALQPGGVLDVVDAESEEMTGND